MSSLHYLINYILHIDVYLNAFVSNYGFWTYLALFAIVFCETGLIVTPFLPGDSLLFAAGSIAAQPENSLNSLFLFLLLVVASILGNQINFSAGSFFGPKLFTAKNSWLLNKKHLIKASQFYNQHGGKTIVFARFIPIIRSFAPFIAGIGKMNVVHFTLYNFFSAILWVGSLIGLGYFLGSLPVVKEHFALAIYGIIGISLLPALITCVHKKTSKRSRAI
jgi:membrane-associated protein